VLVKVGDAPYTPNQWCVRVYRGYLRLEDTGIAGATFGVVGPGVLDWTPPSDAGCVAWPLDPGLNVPKEVILQVRPLRPLPGALLWVLDGDASWRGRPYEVGSDGAARNISGAYWDANQVHFQDVWMNVMPVSWAQVRDPQERGLVGPNL
jgi:hypothetical protein